MKRAPLVLLGSLFVLSITACDSDDATPGEGDIGAGSAEATVSGDYDASFSGNASFMTATIGQNASFEITLFNLSSGQSVSVGGLGELPPPGTYPLRDFNQFLLAADYFETGSPSVSVGDDGGGTLTITVSSSEQVAGSVSFSGEVVTGGSVTGTAAVVAEFSAVPE